MYRYPETVIVFKKKFYKNPHMLEEFCENAYENTLCSVGDCGGDCAFDLINYKKSNAKL